ncbi:Cys-tRNA(Pro)/Cys-tRNA(Cys) deacylase [Desulfoluna limicola]|uniref:Cys-tRNA(Pro)/Cys-tRNA(Cys) deacylase n=1 Tax=Desulfoluna limicola TaxID=2810562 RepID=A0ABM7PFJ7_9BACT|nr:Cys-tRNA(Pro) deacylase [Desulfoluna limicola]BCS96012.1 Cys-tRNA(Pro)/Cys-tRNA(Cys) deacylase [Desulfoluna limicola]
MTPAINLLKKKKIKHNVHSFKHDPNFGAYGDEVVEKLGFEAERVFKTIIVALDGNGKNLCGAIVPVTGLTDLKHVAKAAGAKKAAMADPKEAERATGYITGGISPVGHKKRIPLLLDAQAMDHPTIMVSGGKRGLELELAPEDLIAATGAKVASIHK